MICKFPNGINLLDLAAMFNADYTKKDIAIILSILKYSTKVVVEYQKESDRIITIFLYDAK